MVAFLDLTARLTAERWTPPSCVAQDLGMRLLLDHVDVIADLARLPLPPDWQDTLAELLLEDIDHEYLYDPALDGFEDDPDFGPPGMASMRVQDWFHPTQATSPYPPTSPNHRVQAAEAGATRWHRQRQRTTGSGEVRPLPDRQTAPPRVPPSRRYGAPWRVGGDGLAETWLRPLGVRMRRGS